MQNLDEILESLVARPRESLTIELKSWIDPLTPEGEAKIAKAALALRNQNGGYLVIGFNNELLQADPLPSGYDVREKFHLDVIQAIVSRYASPSFTIDVHFPENRGIRHPVVVIPSGIKTPVVCKKNLSPDGKSKFLLRDKEIYVRTISANGTVSSSVGNSDDIEQLVDRCFQNREADQTLLLAKVFQSIPHADLERVFTGVGDLAKTGVAATGGRDTLLLAGEQRFRAILAGKSEYHRFQGYLDIALIIRGLTKSWEADATFLETLRTANPGLSGWPVWLVSDTFRTLEDRPYFLNETFEEYLYKPFASTKPRLGHLDFMIFDPNGRFFLRSAFKDDLGPDDGRPGKTIEIYLQAWQIAEALAVGRAFATALGRSSETELDFSFGWSGIKNREILLWAHPGAEFIASHKSHQNTSRCNVTITPSANDEQLIATTISILQRLVRPFGTFVIPERYVSVNVRTDVFRRPLL
jgi:hypothetical protein